MNGTWVNLDDETRVRFKDGDVEFYVRQPDNRWRVVLARPVSKEAVDGGVAPWRRITVNLANAASKMARARIDRMRARS